MSTVTDSIRNHQAAFRSLAGIPIPPARFTVGPCAAGGYEVADGAEPHPRRALRAMCAGEADAQHLADDWNARREAQARWATEQGAFAECETDR